MQRQTIAIDVGGVLADKQHEGEPKTGSLSVIARLYQSQDLWIVSMCGKARAVHTRQWLAEHGFEEFIPPHKQIYIPFEAHNKNKELNRISATVFIDDRWKHIGPATNIPRLNCILFCAGEGQHEQWHRSNVAVVHGWDEVEDLL